MLVVIEAFTAVPHGFGVEPRDCDVRLRQRVQLYQRGATVDKQIQHDVVYVGIYIDRYHTTAIPGVLVYR